jgi:hypothetical protein
VARDRLGQLLQPIDAQELGTDGLGGEEAHRRARSPAAVAKVTE